MDYSPPGSSVHGILQARILEWAAIPVSTGSSWRRDRNWVSHTVGRFFTSWATRELPNSPARPVNIWLWISIRIGADAQGLPLGTSPVEVSGDKEALGPHSVETSPSIPTHRLCRHQQMMTQYGNLVLQHQVWVPGTLLCCSPHLELLSFCLLRSYVWQKEKLHFFFYKETKLVI